MNILFLSHLGGESFAGPTYSVPKQIDAQSRIDNVFWYNMMKNGLKEWKKLPYYHDLNDYPKGKISCLPEPFNKPDLVVVELFYNMVKSRVIIDLLVSKIPYIIIPRGELTLKAQQRKSFKKRIANALLCKKYARNALAIEYLTKQEKSDSGNRWNENGIVIPNGITKPNVINQKKFEGCLKYVSIGRIEPYQKGLDLLIEACNNISCEMRKKKCSVDIFGPDSEGKRSSLEELVNKYGIGDIVNLHDGVFHDDKENVLLNANVFLMTSRFEGHPMALIEALSYGVPAIVTTGSNMSEEIDEWQSGWTGSCTVKDIENAIIESFDEKNDYVRIKENAIALSKKYDWNEIAKVTHREYKTLLRKDKK